MIWLLLLPIAALAAAVCLVGLTVYLYLIEAPAQPLPPHPPARPGIWFMSHRADAKRRFPYQHLFIRITPRNPKWKALQPGLFSHTDEQGNAFGTLGAGPVDGLLSAAYNRPWDHEVPVRFEEKSEDCDIEEEDRRIEKLLAAVQAYPNHLRFSAWPPVNGPGYNCNALMLAFAARAWIRPPGFAKRFMLCAGALRHLPPDALRAK